MEIEPLVKRVETTIVHMESNEAGRGLESRFISAATRLGRYPMINRRLNGPDHVRTPLRSAVMAVDSEMFRLKQAKTGNLPVRTERLVENWEQLVSLLALGPEPEYRPCPFCDNIGIRSATRCGACWKKLPPFVS